MKRLIKWISYAFVGLIFLILAVFAVSYYYKSDILAAVNTELKKNINGDIHIGDIDFSLLEDFPSFSITLKDFYLRGEKYQPYTTDFLWAEKISLDVQIVSFLQKKIMIRSVKIVNGDVFIFRTKSGYTNLDIFKKSPDDTITSHNRATITLQKIFLDRVHVTYHDSLKQKSFGINFRAVKTNVTQTDSSYRWLLSGPLTFDELTLNKQHGSFLKQKAAHADWDIDYNPTSQNLTILTSHLKFSASTLDLTGCFHLKNPGHFSLGIQASHLDYQEGILLLTETLQSRLKKFHVDKPVSVTVSLKGSLAGGSNPAIDIHFTFNDSQVVIPNANLSHATVSGTFSNHASDAAARNDENSLLSITSFSGTIEGLPTKLTATFKNLRDPYVTLHSLITLDLSAVNEKVDTLRMKFLSGAFKSEIHYSGKLSEYLDPDKTNFSGSLRGKVSIHNGSFDYKPRQQHFKNINASMRFTKDSVVIDSLIFAVNNNPVSITGNVIGFVPFFHHPDRKGYINLLITSPSFDLSAILSKSAQRKSVRTKSKNKKSISEMLDKLYTKVECDITLQVAKLHYQNFNGSEVRGRLIMNNNSLKAINMKMKLAEGNVNFSLGLNDLQRETQKLSVVGNVEHADIRKFFFAFNNFNQNTISHKNLEGVVKMNVKFNSKITDDFTVLPKSMRGAITLIVNDGKLDNFEPLQKMNNFLFKNRDFEEVQFGEINTRLTLAGPELDIERMEIESSVLRLFLEGRYSFGDSTNLSIQLPLSNLKKRDKTYQPKNIGVDAKAGPSIFLYVHKDETGKTVFAYDPFKRHVKKGNVRK